jgi:hypothetical protein
MSDKTTAWTDEERAAMAEQRDKDYDDAYEKVKVRDCKVCPPDGCKGHRLIIQHQPTSLKIIL